MDNIISIFKDADSLVPEKFSRHLTVNVFFKFGNMPPANGRVEVERNLGGFFSLLKGLRHDLLKTWIDEKSTVAEALATYTMRDGTTYALPVVSVLRFKGDLVEDYRIYMDVNPVLNHKTA